MFCGGVLVAAQQASSTLILCRAPASDAGQCSVEVSIDGVAQLTSSGLVYEYRTGSVVLAIEPSMGPMAGGTKVRVSGEGLSGGEAVCRFGSSAPSSARLSESSTLLWCTSPGMQSEGAVPVEVSVGGLAFSADGHRFMYYTPEVVLRVDPSTGTAGQQHMVTVFGRNFLRGHTACSAGSATESGATWRSSTAVECILPALKEGL